MCPKKQNERYHKPCCVKRECEKCGIGNLKFTEAELSDNNGDKVKWSRYKYITIEGCENADGSPKKILSIVNEETCPVKLVDCLKELILKYPYHRVMANWEKSEYDSNGENLPLDHVLCFHDYSENYVCSYQKEIQSQYFCKNEASLHVTILKDMLVIVLTVNQVQMNIPISLKNMSS